MLIVSVLLAAAGTALIVWGWWRPARNSARIVVLGIGGVVALAGLLGTGLLVWARTATDTSQFARSIVWGASAFGDQDRFPARSIAAGSESRDLVVAGGDAIAGFRTDDGSTLDDALADSGTTAFVVVRGSDLLYEQYFNGSGPEAMQTSFSVAKSVTAALVGIAIDEGVFSSVDDPVTMYVDGLVDRDPRFAAITLRHLLTMSSGLSFDDGGSPWDDPANTYHGTDLREAARSIPRVEAPPGEAFDYIDWNVILLGLALEDAAGMPVTEYAATRLWGPMGAEADGSWSLDSDASGFEKMFVGVNARARDFVRFGLLFRDEGRAGGEQVIDAAFVDEATRVDTDTDPAAQYQYLWWIDEPRHAYYANGDHGQFIYVDPDADVVIVRHGTGPGDIDWIDFFGQVAEYVTPTAG